MMNRIFLLLISYFFIFNTTYAQIDPPSKLSITANALTSFITSLDPRHITQQNKIDETLNDKQEPLKKTKQKKQKKQKTKNNNLIHGHAKKTEKSKQKRIKRNKINIQKNKYKKKEDEKTNNKETQKTNHKKHGYLEDNSTANNILQGINVIRSITEGRYLKFICLVGAGVMSQIMPVISEDVIVRNAQDFNEIGKNPRSPKNSTLIFPNDETIDASNFTSIEDFTGKIEGNNVELKNVKRCLIKKYSPEDSNPETLHLSDIRIKDADINNSPDSMLFNDPLGIIACSVKGSVNIENVHIENSTMNPTADRSDNGLLIGRATDGNLKMQKVCVTNSTIKGTGRYSSVAATIGRHRGGKLTGDNITVNGVTLEQGDDETRVGTIGQASKVYMNNVDVSNSTFIGDGEDTHVAPIVGEVHEYLQLNNSIVDGNKVTGNGNEPYAGGIAGYSPKLYIENTIVNNNNVTAKGYAPGATDTAISRTLNIKNSKFCGNHIKASGKLPLVTKQNGTEQRCHDMPSNTQPRCEYHNPFPSKADTTSPSRISSTGFTRKVTRPSPPSTSFSGMNSSPSRGHAPGTTGPSNTSSTGFTRRVNSTPSSSTVFSGINSSPSRGHTSGGGGNGTTRTISPQTNNAHTSSAQHSSGSNNIVAIAVPLGTVVGLLGLAYAIKAVWNVCYNGMNYWDAFKEPAVTTRQKFCPRSGCCKKKSPEYESFDQNNPFDKNEGESDNMLMGVITSEDQKH